jgi:glycosyltransferase involved in cell wall biosynthesis
MILPYATCTVVIPCYNGEPYLEAAVGSVRAQTYQDYHLVLVDDASQDGTRALAYRLARTRPNTTVVELPENRGRSFARNRGTEMTRGPYVAFLDQDDTYHPDFLRRTAAALSQAPLLDAIKVLPNIAIEIDPLRYSAVANSLATTMLLRRTAFEVCGGWPEGEVFRQHSGGCEDIAFQKLFGFCFNTGVLPQQLYNYVHRPGNALDRFLSRSSVVGGSVVFSGGGEWDQKVRAEIQRLTKLLQAGVRRYVLGQGGGEFARLAEETGLAIDGSSSFPAAPA